MESTAVIAAARIAQVIQPLARRWRSAVDHVMAEYGLSDASGWVLLNTGRLGDGVKQSELAASLNVGGASLVRLIDQLEATNLIERRVDEGDRRANGLFLTPAGRALLTRIEDTLAGMRVRLFEGIDAADLTATVRVLEQLDSAVLAIRDQDR